MLTPTNDQLKRCAQNGEQIAALNTEMGPKYHFFTAQEGRAAVREVDDFISRLSTFDRGARLKTSRNVSEAEFLDFVSAQVLEWDDASRQKVEAAFALIKKPLGELGLNWPNVVSMIRTSGMEEGQAAYTRGTSIMLPERKLAGPLEALAGTLTHEFFHILSRGNPTLRGKLYQIIGFTKCDEVQLPPSLAPRRITNPDAPAFDHAIEVSVAGRKQHVVPVLLATVDTYPDGSQDEFFKFLVLQFWVLDQALDGSHAPVLYKRKDLSGFSEQVGSNTDYVIHPDEILADNFKLLVTGAEGLRSPEIVASMRKVLEEARQA